MNEWRANPAAVVPSNPAKTRSKLVVMLCGYWLVVLMIVTEEVAHVVHPSELDPIQWTFSYAA